MTIKVRDGSGLATIGAIKIRTASGLGGVSQLSIRDGSGLHPMLVSMSAVASPSFVSGTGSSASAIQVSTNATAATVTGGTPPYTYSWTTAGAGWEAISPASKVTNFRSPLLDPTNSSSTTFQCEVTDANGATATSNAVSAEATNLGY